MKEIKNGMLAVSRAGHDKGTLYMIMNVTETELLLCDGKIRTAEHPKKKKRSHVQVICQIPEIWKDRDVQKLRNEEIRSGLKYYSGGLKCQKQM